MHASPWAGESWPLAPHSMAAPKLGMLTAAVAASVVGTGVGGGTGRMADCGVTAARDGDHGSPGTSPGPGATTRPRARNNAHHVLLHAPEDLKLEAFCVNSDVTEGTVPAPEDAKPSHATRAQLDSTNPDFP